MAGYLTPLIRKHIEPAVDACRAAWARGDIAAARRALDGTPWPRLPGGKSPWSQDTRDRVKLTLAEAKKTYTSLTGADWVTSPAAGGVLPALKGGLDAAGSASERMNQRLHDEYRRVRRDGGFVSLIVISLAEVAVARL